MRLLYAWGCLFWNGPFALGHCVSDMVFFIMTLF